MLAIVKLNKNLCDKCSNFVLYQPEAVEWRVWNKAGTRSFTVQPTGTADRQCRSFRGNHSSNNTFTMLTKIRLPFKWDFASRLQALPWQLIATIAILFAALLLAFRAGDFMVWQFTKGVALVCILNVVRITSLTVKN